MDKNDDLLIERFKLVFDNDRDKNIVIYGLGPLTKLIAESLEGYNLVGVLDNCKKDGQIFGLDILDEEKLELYNIDMIIIVARPSNVKLIYRRIENRCKDLRIDVYDISGNNLGHYKESSFKEHRYFERSFSELIKIIDDYDTISFDIFDTLIVRRTLYPTDIFELLKYREDILPEDFARIRMDAERELRLMGKEPSIYDIYKKIYNDNSSIIIDKEDLIRTELELDRSLILVRERMVEALNYCTKKNKSVYLISDMYYTQEMIVEILDGLGIHGYKAIFVSCEYGVSKGSGLFEIYKNSVLKDKLLHIGDDIYADGDSAGKYGLDTYLIKSARDMLELSSYSKILNYSNIVSNRMIIGMFVAKIFNNPFAICVGKGKGIIRNYYEFGYLFIAPFLVKLLLWLIDMHTNKTYDFILFAARDGFLLKKMYDLIKEYGLKQMPRSIYFYTSRMACVPASIRNDEDIIYAYKLAYEGTPGEMLKNRFFLRDCDILPYNNIENDEPYQYILKHRKAIYDMSEKLRNNHIKYFDTLNIDRESKISFFDFVSSGTCQRSLQRILDLPIEGYYVSVIDNDYNKEVRKHMIALYDNDFTYSSKYFICDNYLFLENLLTAPHASVKTINEDGKPEFLVESRNPDQISSIKIIQEAVMDYTVDLLNICSSDIYKDIDKELVDTILRGFTMDYTIDEADLSKLGFLVDEFCNRAFDTYEVL